MVNTLKFKSAIIEAGYTQIDLAEAMGMSKNALNAKVNGRAPITVDEATNFCRILKISEANRKVEIFLC